MIDILVYYDGPQVWLDIDGQGDTRLFFNYENCDKPFDAISGVISPAQIDRLKSNKVKMDRLWQSLRDYRSHKFEPDSYATDAGVSMSPPRAWALEPVGDAYLMAF